MYECRCHSCGATAARETLAVAQQFLTEHAERGHEVEFARAEAVGLESTDGAHRE